MVMGMGSGGCKIWSEREMETHAQVLRGALARVLAFEYTHSLDFSSITCVIDQHRKSS